MARNCNITGSNKYLTANAAPVTAAPLTMACWAKPAVSTGGKTLMCLSDKDANETYFRLVYDESDSVFDVETRQSALAQASKTVTGLEGNWNHFCGVYSAADNRLAYVNGSPGSADTNSVVPSGIDATAIGVLYRPSIAQIFVGDLAEAAIWNAALTQAEVTMLAAGYSPLLVRPESLVAYWPLIGRYSPEIDLVGGLNLTLTNSPPVAAHPRIIYPKRRQLYAPTATAPPGGSILPILNHYYLGT